MGLFKKEPDIKCWNCDKLVSHEKANFKPRTFTNESLAHGDNAEEKLELLNEISDLAGLKKDKDHISSPNQIFGLQEYEYRGHCPECNAELTCFWRGKKSFNKIQGVIIVPKPKPFLCNKCKKPIQRELQVWYSSKFEEDGEITEYLITVCTNCKTEQGYPFEYDLERGIIE